MDGGPHGRCDGERGVAAAGIDSGVIDDDPSLLRATRGGDAAAFGQLYERHAGAALVVARQYTDSAADAEDVVSDAFANVHRALLGGGGPEVAFRAYLFTVVRRVAAVHRTAGRRTEPTDDVATLETASTPVEAAEEPTLAGFERSVVARAFRSLPERWREVLWHSEVEGLTPAQIAPIIGLTANSTAALAYRAREGLRQAYLQEHLQDPLEDGCRAVAGKLGAHVRGGLGTRDTRQVEAHLDDCGDCRALVLELGDVNHGMRGVVAPLVLGLLGVGALAHDLPVAGGLLAGTAALGQPAGAAPAGAGAGGASGASGAGAGGAAAGTGGAAGGATAGAAAGGAVGVLAGASASAVAMVVGAVVVVAAAIVGAVQLLSGPDGAVAQPSPDVSGASQSADLDPTAAADPPSTPGPRASADATADPDDEALADEALADAARGGAAGSVPRATRAPAPRATAPATAPTAAPGAAPTPAPTAAPTAAPTTAPTTPPAPGPADVVVAGPAGGIALTAGVAGQSIALSVTNAGGLPAGQLVAEVDLPLGVTLVDGPLVSVGFGFAPADDATWSCVTGADGRTATCTLGALEPGQEAVLTLTVAVDESFLAAGDESVRVRIAGDGATWESDPIRVDVAASPARLAFGADAPRDVQLVTGRARTLDVPVRNAGGTAVTRAQPAVVELGLPAGVTATAAAPWVCAPGARVLTCTHGSLGAFAQATLALTLDATAAQPGTGTVHVRLTPSAHRPVETHDVAYTLVRPAALTVEAPPALEVAPGTTATLPVTVTNAGGLPATGTTLTLTPPAGAALVEAGGDGWDCGLDDGVATCTGEPAPGAVLTLDVGVDVRPGVVGAVGGLSVAVAAADADLPAAPAGVAVTAVAPLLALADTTAVVDALRGGTLAFAAQVLAQRPGGLPSAAAADVVATVTLPPGITLDPAAVVGQTAGCVAAGQVVTCPLGQLAAGDVVPVQLALRAAGAVRGTIDVRLAATGADPATASTPAVVASANLTPVWSGIGDLDVVEVGAPLLLCAEAYTTPCPAVHRERDNNGLDMRPLDQTPPPGPRASVPVSSTTSLEVPAERPVVWAGLYWSGVRGPADRWSGALDTARLRAPDGTWNDVTAGSITQVTDSSGRQYYQSAVDVTDLVARGGGGAWALADAAVSADRTDRSPTYYAGWSLVVVHGTQAAPGTPGASTVTVHQGGAWIGTAASSPAFVFVGEAGARARIGVVAWDGDRGTTGDRLTLSDVGPLTPSRWDGSRIVGGGSATNALDSTATGWMYPNSLGVDAKGFAEVTLPSGIATLTPSTGGDQYLIGVVTVRTAAAPLVEASAS